MDRLRAFLLALFVFASTAAAAQQCGTLSTCPQASTPLGSNDQIYVVQGGQSKQSTIGQIISQIQGTTAPINVGATPVLNSNNTYLLISDNGILGQIAPDRLSIGVGTTPVNGGTSGYALTIAGGILSAQPFAPWPGSLTGPLIGHGSGLITAGTFSGNTTELATITGALINGHCVSIDALGNLIDAGGACTTGGGGGTVSAASANQFAYYSGAGTVVAGTSVLTLNGANVSTTGAYQISTINMISALTGNSLYIFGPGGNTPANMASATYAIFIGDGAEAACTTCSYSIALGHHSFAANATAAGMVGVGYSTGATITSGAQVTLVGYSTGNGATGLSYSNIIGATSLSASTSGAYIDAICTACLQAVTTGQFIQAMGYGSANATTTGSNIFSAGYQTLHSNVAGSNITAIGQQTLYSYNPTGAADMVAIAGGATCNQCQTGTNIVVVGDNSLFLSHTGSNMTAVGVSVFTNGAGDGTTGMGYEAGFTCGNNNANPCTYDTFIGYKAGFNYSYGSHSIAIGDSANLLSATADSQLSLGNALYGNLATKQLIAATSFQIGSTTFATLATGEFGLAKETPSGTAPGAGFLKMEVVAGSSPGTCKILLYAGTSTTPTSPTTLDNIGAGC